MKTIKFRAWDKITKKMWNDVWFDKASIYYDGWNDKEEKPQRTMPREMIGELMQFTGLKDKNGLHEIYEGDIIDKDGHLVGNIYEHKNVYQEKTNLIIQGFGTATWCSTYQKALEQGCKNSE